MQDRYIFLDFGVNRLQVRNKGMFSNSLEDQFGNLDTGDDDFEDFVRTHFIKDWTKVFVSYPNFNREVTQASKGRYYNNIALRFPQEDDNRDIVLMCDIYERNRDERFPDDPVSRVFQVKAILLIDSHMKHYGELEEDVRAYINLGENKTVLWEADGVDGVAWLPNDVKRNNLLSNDFLVKLSGKYVVKNHAEVLRILDTWSDYLKSREYIIGLDSKKGYDLNECKPEFLKAYFTPGYEGDSDIPFLGRSSWTLAPLNEDSKEGALVHFWIDYPMQEYLPLKKTKKDPKKILDSFTRSPVILRLKGDVDEGDALKLSDNRIKASVEEIIPPDEEISAIQKEGQAQEDRFAKSIKAAKESDVKKCLSAYRNGNLKHLTDSYREEQRGPISKRNEIEQSKLYEAEKEVLEEKKSKAEKELQLLSKQSEETEKSLQATDLELQFIGDKDKKGKVKLKEKQDKLRKSSTKINAEMIKLERSLDDIQKQLESLVSKYDPQPLIESELDALCKQYSSELESAERERLESELDPTYTKQRIEGIAGIRADTEDRCDRVRAEKTVCRLHLYFKLDISDNESIDNILSDLSRYSVPGTKLRKDFFGDNELIRRQRIALENLLNGNVLNPFLATFLFDPSSKGENEDLIAIDGYEIVSLNDSQKHAVKMALSSNGMFLIQGPPGTGKTQVISEITSQLVKLGKKVLIASQNNKAVDNAFDRIPHIPNIRTMRVLSEKAGKQENNYAPAKLTENFYKNISESLEKEADRIENRTRSIKELDDLIEELSDDLNGMKSLEMKAVGIQDKIAQIDQELEEELHKKERIENKNFEIQEKIDIFDDRLDALRELTDGKIVADVCERLEAVGFVPGDYGSPADVIKALSEFGDDIIEEYISLDEHREYFELMQKKALAESAGEISEINKHMSIYRTVHDFDEKETFKLLSRLSKVPDEDIVSEAKNVLDEYIDGEKRKAMLARDKYRESMKDASSCRSEIDYLRKMRGELEKDPIYTRLEEKQRKFDSKIKSISEKLSLPMGINDRMDIIKILRNEQKRLSFQDISETDINEQIGAYRRISRYLSDSDRVKEDSNLYNADLMKLVNVIGMTCSAKSDFKDESEKRVRLSELNIDVVIVDEVSKVPFIEILQPISYGKTVILVGDHKQLPPIFDRRLNEGEENRYDDSIINIENEEKYRRMYENSFFAELFDKSPPNMKVLLTTQYRMHPDIMDVDNVFYKTDENKDGLDFGGNISDKYHYLDIRGSGSKPIIGPNNHVIFIDVRGREQQESGSKSFVNRAEADTVMKLLELLDKNCRSDRNGNNLRTEYKGHKDTRLSLGVICMYGDQAKEIRKKKLSYRAFNNSREEKVMVKSVDDFQGYERDIIIVSMVRTKQSEFLKDYRRINVAISRARRLLIIVGNRSILEKMNVAIDGRTMPVYRNLIRAVERKNGVLMQSDIMEVR